MSDPTEDGSQVRRYRGSPWLTALAAAVLFLFCASLATGAVLLAVVAEGPLVLVILLGAIAAVALLGLVEMLRIVTIVDHDHITVHDLRTQRTAWRDIIAIEVENTPIGAKLVENIAIYHRDGHRIVLPHITNGPKLSVHQEVRSIRELWERRRGEDWTPQPMVAEATKEKSAARWRILGTIQGAMGLGLTAVRLLAFGILAIGLIALATGRADDLPEIPAWVFIAAFAGVGLAPLAFVALAALTSRRDQDR